MAATTAAALELRMVAPQGEDPALFHAMARLLADAYPIMGVKTAADLTHLGERLQQQAADAGTAYVVAQRDGALVGSMRLHDYVMNVRGTDAEAGGVGAVAVALTHKRQGIARAMLAWYLDHYRKRGAPFAILWPFRPDFYRAIGFGYGTPGQRFRFAPATLRDDGARGTVRFLGASDIDALLDCYERVRGRTNGLIVRHRAPLERMLADEELRYVGVERDGALRGFMQTVASSPGARMRNTDELLVRDLAYEDGAAFAALLGYLRAQRDQFARIVVETQDETFYLASADPRDGSDLSVAPPAAHRVAESGLGVMYRILDVPAALGYLPAAAAPFTLRIDVADAFAPQTAGRWTFRFAPDAPPRHAGRPERDGAPGSNGAPQADATLRIGIHDLSSVVLGSLRLRDVVAHRLATFDPPQQLAQVDAAFRTDDKPQCTTRF